VTGSSGITWDDHGVISDVQADCAAIPGLIDTHFHGFAGVGFLGGVPTAEKLTRMDAALLEHGVTSYVPGVCTADPERIAELAASVGTASPEGLVGLYCEGPFVNPECAGALPKEDLRPVDMGLCTEILEAGKNLVRVMLVSPELPGACRLIELLRQWDIVPSVGHSCADLQQARDAMDAGATRATHWPNAMRFGDHHNPGIAQAALVDDRVFLEVIGDGTHLHPAALEIAARCKGSRLVCVSDCMAVTGTDCDPAALSAQGLELKNGRLVRTGTDIHAGASAPFDECARNLSVVYGLPRERALAACSANAAASLHLENLGRIAPGMRADFIEMDEQWRVMRTFRKGVEVWTGSTY
jgi:N-acetylglucosamine-6-phosphate deacetylase